MQNLRINAQKIVQAILEEKIFFGELKKQLSEKDLPFVNMLVLSSLRNWVALNVILNKFLNKKIPHKHREAQYLLLLAIDELLCMNTAPYAVINETVGNVRKVADKFLAGLANAILRKVLQNKNELLKLRDKTFPIADNFLEILAGYSEDEINNIAASLKIVPPLDITVKSNPQLWAEKLGAKLMPNGSLRLFESVKVSQLCGFNEGEWWVQDVASSLPVLALGDVKGKKVLDLCAAPGGKTAQLASRGAEVTAVDISESRLQILQQNMQRLGFSNVHTVVADGLDFLQSSHEEFDAILLDAPCSATGTFRRHPEVLFIKSMQDVHSQADMQKKLLNSCHLALKKGGMLLYSVCSIAKAEGEQQITSFLQNNIHFKQTPISATDVEIFAHWQQNMFLDEASIRTLPYFEAENNGMDSFYMCKMKRII